VIAKAKEILIKHMNKYGNLQYRYMKSENVHVRQEQKRINCGVCLKQGNIMK